MSNKDAITLMIMFAMLIVTLIGVIVSIIIAVTA
ncbi:putative holin-like toxin [Paucilactobacillus hokkaidonensis]|nr:putative holin-like toxin [Paucilactobacillus hokkaidonensis]